MFFLGLGTDSMSLNQHNLICFDLQEIRIEPDHPGAEAKSAKDALLLWCQMKTAGYHNVNIRNFTTSWRDGLAFNAIIHKHRPDLIEYSKLIKSNAMYNHNHAYDIAEREFGLVKLLDAEVRKWTLDSVKLYIRRVRIDSP